MVYVNPRVCPASLLAYTEHDGALLRLLAMPVTDQIVYYVAGRIRSALLVCEYEQPARYMSDIHRNSAPGCAPYRPKWELPPLEDFLAALVYWSDLPTAAALGSMIYLGRISNDLSSDKISTCPE
jgi:hypothetical protein